MNKTDRNKLEKVMTTLEDEYHVLWCEIANADTTRESLGTFLTFIDYMHSLRLRMAELRSATNTIRWMLGWSVDPIGKNSESLEVMRKHYSLKNNKESV